MTNILNKKRKKKGFTLIELVIVLAVLAIIALIAIPNFTKVRNDSLAKSDKETANQIRKMALMAIANEDIAPTTGNYRVEFDDATGKVNNLSPISPATILDLPDVKDMLKEVKKPQVNGKTNYMIKVDGSGNVSVGYATKAGSDFEEKGELAN